MTLGGEGNVEGTSQRGATEDGEERKEEEKRSQALSRTLVPLSTCACLQRVHV